MTSSPKFAPERNNEAPGVASRILTRWSILIGERFAPSVYIPMILIFTGANALYAVRSVSQTWHWGRYVSVFGLLLSFFLRMRVFDELKDYETDLVVNPQRPLARGAASFRQVKRGLFVFILFELVLSYSLGFWPFVTHVLAMFYSLLMFEEFFLSDHIRPHLTTYAVTHTFVSALLGLSAAVAMTKMDLRGVTWFDADFFLMNWAFFNLFEFARKTFAPEEERTSVESYSKIYGVPLAVALSISQAAVGNWLLWRALQNPMIAGNSQLIVASAVAMLFYMITCMLFVFAPSKKTAHVFRSVSSVYLMVHYIIVVLILWWK